jgi:hypothetical protein
MVAAVHNDLETQSTLQSMQKKLMNRNVKFDKKNLASKFGIIRLLLIVSSVIIKINITWN